MKGFYPEIQSLEEMHALRVVEKVTLLRFLFELLWCVTLLINARFRFFILE